MEDLETIIMELLVNAGSARSSALTALQLARKGDFRLLSRQWQNHMSL